MTRITPSVCPTCFVSLDAADEIVNECGIVNSTDAPTPGDIAVCFYCGAINEYDDDLHLRPADPANITNAALVVQRSVRLAIIARAKHLIRAIDGVEPVLTLVSQQ